MDQTFVASKPMNSVGGGDKGHPQDLPSLEEDARTVQFSSDPPAVIAYIVDNAYVPPESMDLEASREGDETAATESQQAEAAEESEPDNQSDGEAETVSDLPVTNQSEGEQAIIPVRVRYSGGPRQSRHSSTAKQDGRSRSASAGATVEMSSLAGRPASAGQPRSSSDKETPQQQLRFNPRRSMLSGVDEAVPDLASSFFNNGGGSMSRPRSETQERQENEAEDKAQPDKSKNHDEMAPDIPRSSSVRSFESSSSVRSFERSNSISSSSSTEKASATDLSKKHFVFKLPVFITSLVLNLVPLLALFIKAIEVHNRRESLKLLLQDVRVRHFFTERIVYTVSFALFMTRQLVRDDVISKATAFVPLSYSLILILIDAINTALEDNDGDEEEEEDRVSRGSVIKASQMRSFARFVFNVLRPLSDPNMHREVTRQEKSGGFRARVMQQVDDALQINGQADVIDNMFLLDTGASFLASNTENIFRHSTDSNSTKEGKASAVRKRTLKRVGSRDSVSSQVTDDEELGEACDSLRGLGFLVLKNQVMGVEIEESMTVRHLAVSRYLLYFLRCSFDRLRV
jgi:hypothetical protein